MTETTIRQITGEEFLKVLYPKTSYAFHPSPPLEDEEEWRKYISSFENVTGFAAFERQEAQACVASSAMTQNIRGVSYPMGGIWGVATDPRARRKGHARKLMTRLLAAVRDLGQPVSGLYPFRESFYQKLGYTTFPQVRIAKLKPADLSPVLRMDLPGQVERVIGTDGFREYRDFLEKYQKRVHGMALVDHVPEFNPYREKTWIAFARVDGETIGSMLYKLEGHAIDFKMKINRFHYLEPAGRYLLLDWIARHVDQASTAEVSLPPFEFPETWHADMNIKYESQFPTPMGRVVDISRLGGMQVGPGAFSASVVDPVCPWNQGAWEFASEDGTLQISQAQGSDCSLSIHAVTAMIYGTHDPGTFSLRGWGDPATDTQEQIRSMFPAQAPFMYEQF